MIQKHGDSGPVSRAALFLLGSLAPLAAVAESESEPNPYRLQPQALDDCALIENGIKRLACFDSAVDTESLNDSATPEQREQVERGTQTIAPKPYGDNGEVAENDNIAEVLVDRRIATEQAFMSFAGSLLPHKQTYILPATYSFNTNQRPYSPTLGFTDYDYDVENLEVKFQISFKVPLLTGIFDDRSTLWFGYTQLSMWQLYNKDDSAPFRETNYEPELFFRYDLGRNLGPGRLDVLMLGFTHQSNGQTEPQSRSWNRITGAAVYGVGRWLFIASPWYRIPESRSDDNNPDIDRYLGYGDLTTVYKVDEDHSISMTLNNNLRSHDNKTSIELGYSFPLGSTIKGYVQYFNGYGESLVDYNVRIQRIGFGVMLHDWL